MTESLSSPQARKLVLLSQRLPGVNRKGGSIEATQSAIEHLGYVQIDTISVIQRAHHHTLWTRNPRYKASHLDQLLTEKQIFEYWSHAAAYLPMRDYRFSLIRKQAIATGDQNHWYEPNLQLMKSVLKRIESEGPLMAKDFKHVARKKGDWSGKPAKQALECLFMQGELMVPRRVNFHKVYDLTERVLQESIDTTLPTQQEYARYLIKRFLLANGLGQAPEMTYLLKNIKSLVTATLKEMILSGEVRQVNVKDQIYYVLSESLPLLSQPLARSKLKILSPFDNLLIQRKRMLDLFDFDYQIECYVPAAKRTYGYFSLPILWDGKLVARMDCKADRKTSVLHINHLVLEPSLKKMEAFSAAFSQELNAFVYFNGCNEVRLHQTTPTNLHAEFCRIIPSVISG